MKTCRRSRATFTTNIREQSLRLKDMLDKLLALAKLEHRTELEEQVPINLHELADTVIADHAIRMQQRDIACDNRIPIDPWVRGEEFLLHQALSNLLDNAIDFSPDGGKITLSLESNNNIHTLVIRDQGSGIPDFALPRVFERFYSLARPTTQQKSTGLGLPFVREVALLHGGDIVLANRDEGGAVARLSLPTK